MVIFLKVDFESGSITSGLYKIPQKCFAKFDEKSQSIIIIEQTKKL